MSTSVSTSIRVQPQRPSSAAEFRHRVHQNVGGIERWLSLLGGGALLGWGAIRRNATGAAAAGLGGFLLWRGATGHCPAYQSLGIRGTDARETAGPLTRAVTAERAVTVNRTPDEIYEFWRDVKNLQLVVPHILAVEVDSPDISHWVMRGPAGRPIRWGARVILDDPNTRLIWESIEGSDVQHIGELELIPAPGDRGTEVHLRVKVWPPLGMVGAVAAKALGASPDREIHRALNRLKQLLETGEIISAAGPSCRGPEHVGRVFAHGGEP